MQHTGLNWNGLADKWQAYRDGDAEELRRASLAGLAAFVAIWTFMLAALMAASIADNIKPDERDIDVAAIEPPVPSHVPVPEAPQPVYSLPSLDGATSVPSPVWTPPAEESAIIEEEIRGSEERITIERSRDSNTPTKITIVGRPSPRAPSSASEPPIITIEPARPAPPRVVEPPVRNAEPVAPAPAPANEAATRVIDDIF